VRTLLRDWRDRLLATLIAMIGVILTVWVYSKIIGIRAHDHHNHLIYLGAILVFFTGVFSFVIFGWLQYQQNQLEVANVQLERQRDVLQGLWDATGVAATLPDMEGVLQRIVDVARSLFGAQYAALAVLSDEDPTQIREFITSGLTEAERQRIGKLPTGRGLLGEVIRTKTVLRLDNLAEHPASSGFPAHHPAMSSFLGLPLLYQGTVVGHLYLTNKPGGFTDQDETTAHLFARQAAVVISNARLYQDREAWATVQERERIGRELHDGVLQTLYGVTLSLELMLDTDHNLDRALHQELNRITETLSLTMTDIRMYIQSLGTSPVDLLVALRDMLQRSGGITDVNLDFHDTEYLTLDPEIVHDLVMSVQEAVSNARRHGHATQITIGWESTEWEYHLWIEDNGQGFEPNAVNSGSHFGLANMTRRIERLEGVIDVTSAIGEGTTIQFRWPTSNQNPHS